ncbi:hypothetical protein GUITHDRAFT_165685, partial [Guillardia theta CCMP2712]
MVHVNSDLTFSTENENYPIGIQPYSLEAYLVNDDSSALDVTNSSVWDETTRSNQSPEQADENRNDSTDQMVAERSYGQRRPVILARPFDHVEPSQTNISSHSHEETAVDMPANFPEGTMLPNIGRLYHFSSDLGPMLDQHELTEEEAQEAVDISLHQDKAEAGFGGLECVICLEKMEVGDQVSTLPCKHTFHHSCIAKWLSAKLNDRLAGCCPSCNLQIVFPVWFEGQHEHVLNQIVVQRSQNNEQLLRFRRNVCSIICVILVA